MMTAQQAAGAGDRRSGDRGSAAKTFGHDHRFEGISVAMVMTDEVECRSSLVPLGTLVLGACLADLLRRCWTIAAKRAIVQPTRRPHASPSIWRDRLRMETRFMDSPAAATYGSRPLGVR
jgi:hypothetical protein